MKECKDYLDESNNQVYTGLEKNKEYEILLSKFYDLDIEKKKKEIYEELERIKSILNIVLQFQDDPNSNDFIPYDPNNTDNEASNLVKVYNNILMIEESLITYLRDKGY